MIYRTLFQFSFHFLPAVFEICGDDVTALQYAARPGITGTSIGSSKLAFWVIKVLMENFSIGLDWDSPVLTISDRNASHSSQVIDKLEG